MKKKKSWFGPFFLLSVFCLSQIYVDKIEDLLYPDVLLPIAIFVMVIYLLRIWSKEKMREYVEYITYVLSVFLIPIFATSHKRQMAHRDWSMWFLEGALFFILMLPYILMLFSFITKCLLSKQEKLGDKIEEAMGAVGNILLSWGTIRYVLLIYPFVFAPIGMEGISQITARIMKLWM